MADLPLFPLNTVLFPGMQLKLHIFEERYKIMINECIDEQKPLGIVLIKDGQEASAALAEPHEIGCMAQITEVKRLQFDRMNIVATGQQRFRINYIKKHQPYLLADVEEFSPVDGNQVLIAYYKKLLQPLITQYIEILSQISDIQFNPLHIPHNARSLAHVGSVLLQSEDKVKQDLLATGTLSLLMRKLLEIYQLETMLLKIRISPPDDNFNIGSFSSN
jgi:uncharacterized protein